MFKINFLTFKLGNPGTGDMLGTFGTTVFPFGRSLGATEVVVGSPDDVATEGGGATAETDSGGGGASRGDASFWFRGLLPSRMSRIHDSKEGTESDDCKINCFISFYWKLKKFIIKNF